MADPLTLAIAAAAASKTVELAGQPVKDGLAALSRKIRGRFRGRPADEEALSGAIADPGDDDRVTRLAEALRRIMAEDPGFAADLEAALDRAMEEDAGFRAEVRARVQQIRIDAASGDGGVTNVFNGNADKAILARDINGPFTIY